MKASANAINLIARYEGFRAKPYKIGNDPWTIGYGETQGIGPHTKPWTEPAARAQLNTRVNRDFAPAVDAFRKRHGLKWTQNQFDALVSFAYNLGTGMFSDLGKTGSSLRKALIARKGVGFALELYSMPGSQFHAGLLRRRQEEAKLFATPDDKRAKLVAELAHRRAQLKVATNSGTRHWLMRRIRSLKTATK